MLEALPQLQELTLGGCVQLGDGALVRASLPGLAAANFAEEDTGADLGYSFPIDGAPLRQVGQAGWLHSRAQRRLGWPCTGCGLRPAACGQ